MVKYSTPKQQANIIKCQSIGERHFLKVIIEMANNSLLLSKDEKTIIKLILEQYFSDEDKNNC